MAIQRMNYFKGEFLHAEDFQCDQEYHLGMRRFHNKYFHTPGIVFGLDVEPGVGKVTITPGMAVDDEGHEIIVEKEMEVQVSAPCVTIGENLGIIPRFSAW